MKKIITYGTFDLIHRGHINIFKKAKEIADYLVVAISTDEFNEIKNKKSFYSYDERKYILESIKYVDEVIPESNWKQKINDIKKHEIDYFIMGDDWEGAFDFLEEYCKVIYVNRTVGISSTEIRAFKDETE